MLQKNKPAALGNAGVIEILEAYLAEARKGQLNYIALTATQAPNQWGIAQGGEGDMGAVALKGLRELEVEIIRRAENGMMPPADEFLGLDYVCYNLAVCPVSFDFLYWLVTAEMARRRARTLAPLKVQFWWGRDGIGRSNEAPIKQMFEGVLRPLVSLFGAIEIPPGEIVGRCPIVYSTKEIVRGVKAGESIPIAQPSAQVHEGVARWLAERRVQRPVTITLREAQYWDHRNSNLREWLKFARYLRLQGEQVVFVRDTNKAEEILDGEMIYPAASRNLEVRVALYQAAKHNFFIANGPGALAAFTGAPMCMFIAPEPDDSAYFPNGAKFWKDQMGIVIGGQYPWARPDQRIFWQQDTCANMIAAWESTVGALSDHEPAGINRATKCLSVAESRKDTFGQVVTAPVARHG
jgi:hypothetical protein